MLDMPQDKSNADVAGGLSPWATGPPWRQGMAAGRFVRHGDVENILGKDHGNSVHFCL